VLVVEVIIWYLILQEDSKKKKDINKNIKLLTINTDLQALSTMDDKNITFIQIGKKTARGSGAGINPEIGRKLAIEDYDDIKKALCKLI
jgi:cell division GTPase FtsZ